MSNVADGSNIDGGLARDREESLGSYFFCLLVALLGKVGLFTHEFFYFFFA